MTRMNITGLNTGGRRGRDQGKSLRIPKDQSKDE